MKNNLVSLSDVSFAYSEDKPILKSVNLDIEQGKITAIMGGSGSGKTTVLRLISGQITANSGTSRVFGQDMANLPKKDVLKLRQKLGMLFQFGALFTDMTVAENVAFPLIENTDLPTSIIHKMVAMKLEAVGLTGTQEMAPNELSGGMARRVALARAIALDPELMLYDEPFTGLDPISLNITAMLIKKLNDNLGQTAVLVSHDIEATMKIADYVYFMANGEIIDHGTPIEVANTTNPAVRQFIRGELGGSFSYKYPAKNGYEYYLGRN
ncbi:ABC transporter ATP-binding protein [Aquella oligotrophica]|uniref:ABC transporter ATP-binding protein n=1 Tax=Aquella oligotrophica TaxID=2067065 RepID=A0A2I7N4B7_9NEIS|nr:ATP-binding cassette domain-containing protein [Aquella oligotrophica]AUR51304.1 ABC transporter ATP-binding protein [Aquella oligotrophica]